MGLDMYLRASEYISRYNYTPEYEPVQTPLFAEIVKQFDVVDYLDTDGAAGISIEFPMGYWRKVNAVHNWFVKNIAIDGIDNCQTMYVSREHLEALKDDCQAVLKNSTLAEELLPTGAGFFFGSTEYDEWYFGGLEQTVEIINRCLKSPFHDFEYQASW
jgi:hypothetical protein